MDQSNQYEFKDFVSLLRRFVADEINFEQFEKQYWTIYNNIAEEQIQNERDMFDDIYEMMYMCENDPVTRDDKKYGFVGRKEIKERIAASLVVLKESA